MCWPAATENDRDVAGSRLPFSSLSIRILVLETFVVTRIVPVGIIAVGTMVGRGAGDGVTAVDVGVALSFRTDKTRLPSKLDVAATGCCLSSVAFRTLSRTKS